MLRVHNDILRAIDNQKGVFLVLLDLSAAFDTVNHAILLDRMSNRFGVKGTAPKWFQSYLTDRSFCVAAEGSVSSSKNMLYAARVNSWSHLISNVPVGDIIEHNIDFYLNADDTQLYISFETSSDDINSAKLNIESCVKEIDLWMTNNKLN